MPKGKPIEGKKGKKMTEAEFKKALYEIFKKSDENQSYRIDKGNEFDNFLVQYKNLIGEDGSHMSRD